MKLHIDPEAPRDILDEGDNLVAKVFVTRDIAKDAGREALARQFAASGEMKEAVLAYEALENQRMNCEECGESPEMIAEACEKCFPFADDLRLKMRAALAAAEGK